VTTLDAGLGGLVIIDKPSGMTSHDVVARMRRLAGTRRVGHAGTLDPMATGVLVLGIERATRLLTFLVGHDKQYVATMRLGASTVTDDVEGDVIAEVDASHLTPELVRAAVRNFVGHIEQRPSSVSAIKIDGQRSYARVRDGQDVILPTRPVTVSEFVIGDCTIVESTVGSALDVTVTVTVSSGTYVRALARDLGDALGVGGHLTSLRRTRSGPFSLADATALEDMSDIPLIPLASAVESALGRFDVTEEEAVLVGHGRAIPVSRPVSGPVSGPVGVFGPSGEVLSIAVETDGMLKPKVVFT
jgi:tRNA pseudouridine55 synthase